MNCEQYKSKLSWFSYNICSNFEKLYFVPANIILDIKIKDLATAKISSHKNIKISPSTEINLRENESRENESPRNLIAFR